MDLKGVPLTNSCKGDQLAALPKIGKAFFSVGPENPLFHGKILSWVGGNRMTNPGKAGGPAGEVSLFLRPGDFVSPAQKHYS